MPIPSESSTYTRKSAKEIVMDTVQDWIVTGVMKPGERIVDTELAKYFSVSRTPVREAIQALAEQGFIDIVPSCGTTVSMIHFEDVRQCYEMIAEIQALAVRFAAERITAADLKELKALNARFEKAVKKQDTKAQTEADEEFHELFVNKADNVYLSSYSHQLQIRSLRVENLFFSGDMGQEMSVQQHDSIIKALENGNVAAAEEAMRENWMHTYRGVKEILQKES